MRRANHSPLLKSLFTFFLVSGLLISTVAESRVGGGRSFGNRGSRGFSTPSRSAPTPYRSYGDRNSGTYGNGSRGQPYQQPSSPAPANSRYSFLKSMGAGLAGGMLGSMLFRSLGVAGPMSGFGGGVGHGGGFGILELLLLAGLIFLVVRWFMKRNESTSHNFQRENSVRESYFSPREELPRDSSNGEGGAEQLMREARPQGWSSHETNTAAATPIYSDQAMDLFFQIQGAWSGRDLSSIQSILAPDAKRFLEEEIYRLRSLGRINRLENIAVRNTEVIESWREFDKDFSTVQFTANLLDFTIDEKTQEVLEGSRTNPVKFEEYWTFVRDPGSNWKLSAIQQN